MKMFGCFGLTVAWSLASTETYDLPGAKVSWKDSLSESSSDRRRFLAGDETKNKIQQTKFLIDS